jgi:carbon storage regulator CsrA
MLVLSRKIGEEIVIGDNIRVTVVAVRGNQVRLGFSAPEDVVIQRAELREFTTPAEPHYCLASR